MLFPTAQQHSYRIVQFLQLEFLRAPHLKRSDGADATRRAIGAADIIRMLPGAGRRPSCGFSGQILRQASLYTLPESPVTENSPLAEVAKRLPRAVVCLVSALSYHEITTQIPHEIWLTIPRSSWRPDVKYPPLNLTYVSGAAYSFGIQQHVINVSVNSSTRGWLRQLHIPGQQCFEGGIVTGIQVG